MGCDIHLRVEILEDDKWVDGNLYTADKDLVEFYNGRDYNLFGILADVRNEHFMGAIDEPRGLPNDAIAFHIEDLENCDYHSQTYFTYQELLRAIDKYSTTKHSGFISPADNEKLLKYGESPSEWCQGTSNKEWIRAEWYTNTNPLVPFMEAFKIVAAMHWKQYRPNEIRVLIAFDN